MRMSCLKKEMEWYGELLRACERFDRDVGRLLSWIDENRPPHYIPCPSQEPDLCDVVYGEGMYKWPAAGKFFEFTLRLLLGDNEPVVTTFMAEINRVLDGGDWAGHNKGPDILGVMQSSGDLVADPQGATWRAHAVRGNRLRNALDEVCGKTPQTPRMGSPGVVGYFDPARTVNLRSVVLVVDQHEIYVEVEGKGEQQKQVSALLFFVVPLLLNKGMSVDAVLRATAKRFEEIKMPAGKLSGVWNVDKEYLDQERADAEGRV